MIWLTWRQFRVQAWAASAALALLAVILAVTGVGLAHLYDSMGLGTCGGSGCGTVADSFLSAAKHDVAYEVLYYFGIVVMYVLPAVIGVFWGAPLITREIETGTFRVAWNQGVTRTRWLIVKLALVGLAAMAAAGLLSLMVTWWSEPIQRAASLTGPGRGTSAINWFAPAMFGARGVAPIGYAAFAFALGVTLGVLSRRTVLAMALTLVAFICVQVAWPLVVRQHLISPVTATQALNVANINGLRAGGGVFTVYANVDMPGAWVISEPVVGFSGHVYNGPQPQACQKESFQACGNALSRLHLRQVITYEPASRYWDFQWLETGIFLAFALALAGFCFWWVSRRRLA